MAKTISVYLHPHKVMYIENPIKAIAWLKEGNMPDLIVSALELPEMSGEDFFCYLKAHETFSDIPVFILSSVDSNDDRVRFLEQGAEKWILKPVNTMELKVMIRKCIG